jgi:hypothetical protein
MPRERGLLGAAVIPRRPSIFLASFSACTRSTMPRHGLPNAIAENETNDHAKQVVHLS